MKCTGRASLFAGVLVVSSAVSGDIRGTRGFIVTGFAPAIYEEGNPCPEGFAGPDAQAILAKLPRAERMRLERPENKLGLIQVACAAFAAENVASTVPIFKTVQGKLSYGLNLDGSDGRTPRLKSCAHEDFVSPNGEAGIDNQWYRAIGCMKESRPGGPLHEYFNQSLRRGELTILIELHGVDDSSNDSQVQVGFYRAAESTASARQAARGTAHAEVYYDRYFHSVTSGRIVKGVLTSEPVDMHFKPPAGMRELVIRDARVRMELQAGGELKGILSGYQELRVLHDAAREALHWDTTLGPLTCRGFLPTVVAWTDGYPDPQEDGPCEWISVAYEVEAVPATVRHPEAARQQVATAAEESANWWRKLLWWQR